jgi:adenine deaminase
MSKKEASRIDGLLKELSEQHKPASYIFKSVNILTMLDSQIIEQDILIENGVIKQMDAFTSDKWSNFC